MKKIFGLLTIGLVCLLSACSFLYTLDVEGNATITVDRAITVNVVDYNVNLVTATATVEFTNTSDETVDFKISDVKCFNVENEDETLLVVPLNISNPLGTNEIKAGGTVKYTFGVTYLTADLNDYKVSFLLNDTELFIALNSESK